MRQGREIHREIFYKGYDVGKKEESKRLRTFLETLEMRGIDDIIENADVNDMKRLGEMMTKIIKSKIIL